MPQNRCHRNFESSSFTRMDFASPRSRAEAGTSSCCCTAFRTTLARCCRSRAASSPPVSARSLRISAAIDRPTPLRTAITGPSLSRDAVGLIDAAGAETATIVGHDWGAVTAYVAASLAPARVRRIVTMPVPPPRIFIPSFSATPRRSGGAGTWGTSSCRAPRPASPPTISHSSIGSGAIGAPAGISRPSASPASRRRSATRKARAKRSATIDRSCVPSSSPARARSRLIASRSRASPCPPSSSRAIATDASRARCTPGSRARSRARSVSRSSAAPVTSYRSRRRIASPISRSRSPAPGRAHRPRKRASRRSTKDWRPSLKSSVAKTAFSIDGIAATATRSASAR